MASNARHATARLARPCSPKRHAASAARAQRPAFAVMYDLRVAFTDADYAAISPRNKGFSALAGKHFLDHDSPAAAIHADIGALPGDRFLAKRRVGASAPPDLARRIGETRGISSTGAGRHQHQRLRALDPARRGGPGFPAVRAGRLLRRSRCAEGSRRCWRITFFRASGRHHRSGRPIPPMTG